MPEPLREFFPEIGDDLTQVTWEHGVNSKEKLYKALEGNCLMIEADILIGHIKGEESESKRPIMAHPPEISSDLSLEEFLDIFSNSGVRKGIKLDFKSTQAFSRSQFILESALYNRGVDYPVWLNADIIEGPGGGEVEPVDADYFLSSSIAKFPMVTLSLGWTTRNGEGVEGIYTSQMVNSMTEALSKNRITSPVTFAVRAAFAAKSQDALVNLIHTSVPGTTLTIWSSSPGDRPEMKQLRNLIHTIGHDKIYVDLPPEMLVALAYPVDSGADLGKHSPLVSAALLALGTSFLAR